MKAQQKLSLALFPQLNPNPSLRLSDEGAILYANPAAARLLKEIQLDPSHPELLFPSNLRERLMVLANMEMGVDTWEYQIGDRIISCFIHYLPEYRVFHAYLTDVTEARRVEMQLYRQTNYDSLTGLPNRYLFEERLQDAIFTAKRGRRTGREQIGLFLISLDRFHHVNLTLGRAVGDQLLQGMAVRLRQVTKAIGDGMCVRPYRYQGDIFAIKAPDMSCLGEPTALVEILLEHMKVPFHCGDQDIFMTASIGISLYPLDSSDSASMVRNAETAMFEAKMDGGNNFRYYTQSLNQEAHHWLALESDLHGAIERNEMHLYYQPQVEAQTGRIIGAEALIRWQRPSGIVSPLDFIPVAEETGLIRPIGVWALKTACQQQLQWQRSGLNLQTVSVNVSARQFDQTDFLPIVTGVLQDSGLEPALLELEITESLAMLDPERTINELKALKQIGAHVAIDDFGTGYSSLSYLKKFPIDTLKVDQSFIRSMTTDAADASIAQAVIALAHSLKMKVIAEGVETQAQLQMLQSLACDEIQGFVFSQPVTAEVISHMLQST